MGDVFICLSLDFRLSRLPRLKRCARVSWKGSTSPGKTTRSPSHHLLLCPSTQLLYTLGTLGQSHPHRAGAGALQVSHILEIFQVEQSV